MNDLFLTTETIICNNSNVYVDNTKPLTLHKEIKFSIYDFFRKCDQIPCFLQIWSHLLSKSLMENVIFCAVLCNSLLKLNDAWFSDTITNWS